MAPSADTLICSPDGTILPGQWCHNAQEVVALVAELAEHIPEALAVPNPDLDLTAMRHDLDRIHRAVIAAQTITEAS